jgi:hypothetical protein
MKNKLFLLATILALSGCSDGVPEVKDPRHPRDFDGTEMKAKDWIIKFCADKPENKKCLSVAHAMRLDSGKGGLPKGW